MADTYSNIGGVSLPRLRVAISGPKVGKARLSVDDLAEIICRAQQALRRVAQVLYGQQSGGQGRRRREIEELCELFLIEWKPGSAVAELELAEPPVQLHLFQYIGEESLKKLVEGMAVIAKGDTTSSNLPTGFDMGVLTACESLGNVLGHGIEAIRFEARDGQGFSSAIYDPPFRNKIRELLGQPIGVSGIAKVGRLEILSGHGTLTGRLWEPDGTKWICYFKDEHREVLPNAWMRTVKVVGQAILGEKKDPQLQVDSILVLEDVGGIGESMEGISFWKLLSLDELADIQGITRASDIGEISALWPADDDPDELMRHILNERAARQKTVGSGV
jgi:hypothetical protein